MSDASAEPPPLPTLALLAAAIDTAGHSSVYFAPTLLEHQGAALFTASVIDGTVIPVRCTELSALGSAEGGDDEGSEDLPLLVHFSTVFPFTIDPGATNAMMEAVLILNRFYPLCAFGVSPADRSCYLAGCVAVESSDEIDGPAIACTVDMICLAVEKHYRDLRGLALGEATLAQFYATLAVGGFPLTSIRPASL